MNQRGCARVPPRLAYTTSHGKAYQGDARDLMMGMPAGSVDLIVTSPPFALTRQKSYGNVDVAGYLDWFDTFIAPIRHVLAPTGSLVVDVGGTYLPGVPRRSTYQFQLATLLDAALPLCQEFYWFNPAKLPAPAEWVTIKRIRVKDSVNLLLWCAKDPAATKADNRRVLREYSASMRALLKNGYQYKTRPSGHDISDNFVTDHGGAIPPNLIGSTDGTALLGEPWEAAFESLLAISNTTSNDRYLRACADYEYKPHPARFPLGLPAFFIQFLTEPGDVVLDPFAGSGTTAEAAQLLDRQWVTCDLDREGARSGTYVLGSALRFDKVKWARGFR